MHRPQNTAYAKRNDKLIHVSEASRGDSCDCVCVLCGGALTAKKGPVRRHHFAHSFDSNCSGAAESVLHLLSKELIQEMSSIVLPPYHYWISRKLKSGAEVSHDQSVVKGGVVTIDRVDLETDEDGFRPDVILHSGSKKLIVEIVVTNKVTREKLRRIRKSSLPVIEILLIEEDSLLSRDELRKKLCEDVHSKEWIFHPKQREVERVFISKWRDAIREARRLAQEARARLNTLRNAQINKPDTPQKKVLKIFSQGSVSPYELRKYDQEVFNFQVRYGRPPTDEESLRRWPNIWKKY